MNNIFHNKFIGFRINQTFLSLINKAGNSKDYINQSHFIRSCVIKELRKRYPKEMIRREQKLTLSYLEEGNNIED